MNDQIIQKKKREYQKRQSITDRSFVFTKELLTRLEYQGNGIAPDKRFDTKSEGLCFFVYPSGKKTFFAFAKKEMFNKKKGKTEKNNCYKKMFNFGDAAEKSLDSARSSVPASVAAILVPTAIAKEEKTFGSLAKKFLESGFKGYRLADKNSDKYEYKKSTIKKYTKIINSYLLLKGSPAIQEKLSKSVEYNEVISMKPLKDYTLKEIEPWHIECVQHRLKDSKVVANDVVRMISIIYSWSYEHNHWKGVNPAYSIGKFPEKKIKARLSDTEVDLILNHCESKAFDYNPHFLTIVAMVLYTGCRGLEMYGLRWTEPRTEEEKLKCSGWLEQGWENLNEKTHIFLWDPKNRKEFRPYIRKPLKQLLNRLRKKLYNDPKVSWCLKSDYIFPKTRWSANYPEEHIDSNALAYPLRDLNEKFGLTYETESGRLKNLFTMKIGRKTFVSQVAKEQGVEIASRAVNHSDTKVTRDHYIVPEEKDLEFELEENRSNVSNIEQHRIEKLKEVK